MNKYSNSDLDRLSGEILELKIEVAQLKSLIVSLKKDVHNISSDTHASAVDLGVIKDIAVCQTDSNQDISLYFMLAVVTAVGLCICYSFFYGFSGDNSDVIINAVNERANTILQHTTDQSKIVVDTTIDLGINLSNSLNRLEHDIISKQTPVLDGVEIKSIETIKKNFGNLLENL